MNKTLQQLGAYLINFRTLPTLTIMDKQLSGPTGCVIERTMILFMWQLGVELILVSKYYYYYCQWKRI